MKDKTSSNEEFIEDLLFKECERYNELPLRQKKILGATIKLFSEKGFQGSTTSEIAKEAKVSEGTIFNYYKSKKDLLLGLLIPIVINVIKPIITLSTEKILSGDKKERIDDVMHRLLLDRLMIVRDNYPLIKTILIESMYHPELLSILRKELYPKLIELIDGYVEDNIKNNNFKDIDKRAISRTIISTVVGFIILGNLVPEYFECESDDKEIENIVKIVLYGIAKDKE